MYKKVATFLRLVLVLICLSFSIDLEAKRQPERSIKNLSTKKLDIQSYRSSILLLRSASEDICGTGTLLENGDILTADHLIRDLCPTGQCDNLTIERDLAVTQGKAEVERELTTGIRYSIKVSLPSFDIVLLRPNNSSGGDATLKGAFKLGPTDQIAESLFGEAVIKNENNVVSPIPNAEQKIGQKITAMSYLGCESLEISEGQIEENDPVSYRTSAIGDYGSSGGALIDKDGQLIGIITEASSPMQLFKARVLGSSFPVKASAILPTIILNGTEEGSLVSEAKVIIDFYNHKIKELKNDSLRKWYDQELFSLVSGFRERVLASGQPADPFKPLFASDSFPANVIALLINRPAPPSKQLHMLSDEIALINSYEKNGLNSSLFKKIDPLITIDLLKSYGYRQRAEQITSYSKNRYYGANLLWIAYYLYSAVLLAAFLVIYFFSLGYVWGKETAPLLKKLLIVIIVGTLAWPLSLIVYKIRLLRLRREVSS
jgi:Trypsin-like peptidase domain